MSTSVAVPQTQGRSRLTALRKVLIAALVGNVLVGTVMQVQISRLIPPLAVIMALTLVIAGLCASRWRWAPLLTVLWSVASIIPGLEPYTYSLTHPTETSAFVVTLVGLALSIIIVVAGVAVTILGERAAAGEHGPRWLQGFLIGIAAFVLGTSLVAAIPTSDATAGVSAAALAQLPALMRTRDRYDRAELRTKVGETVALRLENSDAETHYFDID